MQPYTNPLIILILLTVLLPFCVWSQAEKVPSLNHAIDSTAQNVNAPPDWLSAGMMEVGSGGQMQASARVVRLFIGEPGKWRVPLSLYSGVVQPGSGIAGVPVSAGRSNESITWQLYSVWSGMVNVGFEGQRIWTSWGDQSGCRFVFQLGERLLTGYRASSINDPLQGKQQLLSNHYLVAGCVLHTGAWERGNPRNLGRGWVMFRGHLNYSAPDELRWLFPLPQLRGWYGGGSLALGIEVSRVVNLRATICWPWLRPEWTSVRSLTQFSFQYNWKP